MILDPFLGSGTTAVAAINTNRHYVGYDISRNYIKLSKERIKKASNEKEEKLF